MMQVLEAVHSAITLKISQKEKPKLNLINLHRIREGANQDQNDDDPMMKSIQKKNTSNAGATPSSTRTKIKKKKQEREEKRRETS